MDSIIEKGVSRLLIFVFLLVGIGLVFWKFHVRRPPVREVSVMIEGHVKRPGMYYVPYGTTRFEVLQVAGVLPNSDINNVDVNAPVTAGDKDSVGTLDKNVSLK